MSNNIYVALILTLLSVTNLSAQSYEIRGQVLDHKNNPLPYVVLIVEGKGNIAATNTKGEFAIMLSSGSYTIKASLLGYKSVAKNVTIHKNTKLLYVLHEDYKQLGEVLVVGPNHAQQMQQGVYSAKSLNVRPYVASNNNLNQLLSYTSGVRIREEGGVGSNFDLSLSGMGGNAIRYFIDGVPLTSLGSGANVANLPINIVDRVEIFKGVVPPELGLDALGGAVNIITRKERNNYLDLSINGGSFVTYGGDINGQYRLPANGLTVRGNLSYTSSLNNYIMRGVEVWSEEKYDYITGDYRRFHDGYRSITGEVQAGFTNTKWADEALLGVYYSKSNSEIQTGFSQKLVIGEAERYRDALRVSLNYSKRDLFIKGLTAKFFASFTNDHILFADTSFNKYFWDGSYLEGNKSEITRRGKMLRHTVRPTTVGRANVAYTLSPSSSLSLNYTLTANHNNRYDTYDEDFKPSSDFLARHVLGLSYSKFFWSDRVNTTLFIKDYILHASIDQEVMYQDDTYWITGVRDVEPKITQNHFGFGFGSRVTLSKGFSLKASYEYATRLPTARELFGNGASIYPNFKLKPEQAHNFNLSMYGSYQIGDLHRFNYEGLFFVRDVSNYIRRDVVSDELSTYTNVGKARVLGGEIELRYNYHRFLDIALNATYADERNRSERLQTGQIDINYNNRIPNKPFFYANASLGLLFKEPFGISKSQLTVNSSLGYVHWFYLTWSSLGAKESKAIIPTQTSTNVGVTWAFNNNKQTISVNCNNLFNEINYDNYRLQKPGRSIFCKLSTFF